MAKKRRCMQHGAPLPSDPYQGKIRMAPSEHENADRGKSSQSFPPPPAPILPIRPLRSNNLVPKTARSALVWTRLCSLLRLCCRSYRRFLSS
jgi:hypothetical protein